MRSLIVALVLIAFPASAGIVGNPFVSFPAPAGPPSSFDPESDVSSATLWAGYTFFDSTTLYTNTACTAAVTTNGDSIQCAADISANGYDLTEATDPPTYNTAIFSTSGGRFDGTEHLRNSAVTFGSTELTVFIQMINVVTGFDRPIVSMETATGTWDSEFDSWALSDRDTNLLGTFYNNGGIFFDSTNPISGNTTLRYTHDFDDAGGQSAEIFFNGVSQNTAGYESGAFGTFDPTVLTLARDRAGANISEIDVCAMLIYDGIPNAADTIAIENWLSSNC